MVRHHTEWGDLVPLIETVVNIALYIIKLVTIHGPLNGSGGQGVR